MAPPRPLSATYRQRPEFVRQASAVRGGEKVSARGEHLSARGEEASRSVPGSWAWCLAQKLAEFVLEVGRAAEDPFVRPDAEPPSVAYGQVGSARTVGSLIRLGGVELTPVVFGRDQQPLVRHVEAASDTVRVDDGA